MQIVSQTTSWGFFGSSETNYGLSDADLAILFQRAGEQIVAAGLVANAEQAVEFLDGRLGWHFSDALSFHVVGLPTLDQLTAAVAVELQKQLPMWKKWLRTFNRS